MSVMWAANQPAKTAIMNNIHESRFGINPLLQSVFAAML